MTRFWLCYGLFNHAYKIVRLLLQDVLSFQICGRQTVRTKTRIRCGLMRECVYKTPLRDTSDLKQRLIDAWASVSQNVIDEAVGQWRKRLRARVAKKNQFEHLLNT